MSKSNSKELLEKIIQRLEKKAKTSQTPGAILRNDLLKKGFNSKTFGKEFVAAIKENATNKDTWEETISKLKGSIASIVKPPQKGGKMEMEGEEVKVEEEEVEEEDPVTQNVHLPNVAAPPPPGPLGHDRPPLPPPVHVTIFNGIYESSLAFTLLVFMYVLLVGFENLFPAQQGPWTTSTIVGDTYMPELDSTVQEVTQGSSMVHENAFGGAAASLLQSLYSEAGIIEPMEALTMQHLSGESLPTSHSSPPSPEAIQSVYNTLVENEQRLPEDLVDTALLFMARILMRYNIGAQGGGKRRRTRKSKRNKRRSKRRNRTNKRRKLKHRKTKKSKRRNKKSKKRRH